MMWSHAASVLTKGKSCLKLLPLFPFFFPNTDDLISALERKQACPSRTASHSHLRFSSICLNIQLLKCSPDISQLSDEYEVLQSITEQLFLNKIKKWYLCSRCCSSSVMSLIQNAEVLSGNSCQGHHRQNLMSSSTGSRNHVSAVFDQSHDLGEMTREKRGFLEEEKTLNKKVDLETVKYCDQYAYSAFLF